jgi:hypothetical protein
MMGPMAIVGLWSPYPVFESTTNPAATNEADSTTVVTSALKGLVLLLARKAARRPLSTEDTDVKGELAYRLQTPTDPPAGR